MEQEDKLGQGERRAVELMWSSLSCDLAILHRKHVALSLNAFWYVNVRLNFL